MPGDLEALSGVGLHGYHRLKDHHLPASAVEGPSATPGFLYGAGIQNQGFCRLPASPALM